MVGVWTILKDTNVITLHAVSSLMCTAAPKKAPHPQMSTNFTMWCNPKAFKLSSTTLFSGLAGGYCAISSDQRQDGDRLAEPQNAVCDATSALSTRGEILSKGCSCQTAEMELRTTANILQSLARKISILPFFSIKSFQNCSNIHIRLDSFTLKRYQQSSVFKEKRSLVSTKNYVNLNLKNSSCPV